MGVILNGILGGVSGKVGGVVGGKWKDVNYVRAYAVPENPNSTGQQTQRAKFSAAVDFARQILGSILQPLWDPFYSSMSGFNAWISQNIGLLDGSNELTTSAIMGKGTLTPTAMLTKTYDTASGAVEVTFLNSAAGNQTTSDIAVLVAYDQANNQLYSEITPYSRVTGGADITIPAGLTASNVKIYLFFKQGSGSSLLVSDSVGAVADAA